MTESFENLFGEASGKNWTLNLESNSGISELLIFNECVDVTGVSEVNAEYKNLITEDGGQWNYYLSNLSDGSQVFYECSNLTSFNVDLPSLINGYHMFSNSAITSFDSNLTSLTNGDNMFYNTNLESFNSDLSSLTNGHGMFGACFSLTTFNSDLSSLINGVSMFGGTKLTSFDSDLSSLTNGHGMFGACFSLTTFNSDLSSLKNGDNMFYGCSSLTTFDSDLSSLTTAWFMFKSCKLNTASVKNIASTINTVSSGKIYIEIGNSTPNAEEETAFNTMVSKGWTVFVNGSSWTSTDSTSTTNLTEEEQSSASIPFYAKPIQVTEDEAEYVDANNNYYNIVGAQFIYGDDLSTYGQFTSFEHAESEITLSLGLTKYTKPTE